MNYAALHLIMMANGENMKIGTIFAPISMAQSAIDLQWLVSAVSLSVFALVILVSKYLPFHQTATALVLHHINV